MNLRGLVISKTELKCSLSQFPHSCTCICERFIYFSRSVCLFYYSQIGRPILGIYKIAHRYMNVGMRERDCTVSFLGIHKSDFRNSAEAKLFFFLLCHSDPGRTHLLFRDFLSYLGGGHGVDHRHGRAGHQPHQQSHVQSRRYNLCVTTPMLLLV